MCGLFGMIRNDEAVCVERATAAFVELGNLAVERGRDASGFAITQGRSNANAYKSLPLDRGYVGDGDGVAIVKGTVAWPKLWNDGEHAGLVATAKAVIGHTRWATQGNKYSLTNASPLAVGNLVGTHNGDVDTYSVDGYYRLPKAVGSTDTERLYQALNRDRLDRRKLVKILEKVEGRAALAWFDRGREDRVYLARAALSPLSIAWDVDGNLYWASNPDWFRQVDEKLGGAIGFRDLVIVREGTLLTINIEGAQPVIEDMREFKPICRDSDSSLAEFVVWRGFVNTDIAADQAQTNHRVAAPKATARSWGGSAGTLGTSTYSGERAHGGKYGNSKVGFSGTSAWSEGFSAETGQTFAGQSSLGARLAAEEPEFADAEFADDDFDEDLDPQIVRAEVDEAVLEWAETGYSEVLVKALREATTDEAEQALMEKYQFSAQEVYDRFKEEVLAWADQMAAMTTD